MTIARGKGSRVPNCQPVPTIQQTCPSDKYCTEPSLSSIVEDTMGYTCSENWKLRPMKEAMLEYATAALEAVHILYHSLESSRVKYRGKSKVAKGLGVFRRGTSLGLHRLLVAFVMIQKTKTRNPASGPCITNIGLLEENGQVLGLWLWYLLKMRTLDVWGAIYPRGLWKELAEITEMKNLMQEPWNDYFDFYHLFLELAEMLRKYCGNVA
ncbi:hypothetical protein FB45DRAFT_883268 [Roridomyces roridus]|uniref:Uncharacterized protein n=1 Tax=Roridomyces roridus TaxID=1738132 RepID=A0AAD7F5I8_9AGAR|nr:hypothetical protein FB45DRAFT_883268 [Roridomyces roridus]